MTFKKNWFTDLIWAVTAAIIGLNIVGYVKLFMSGYSDVESLRLSGSVLYDVIWLGMSAVVMAVLICIYFLIHMISKRINRQSDEISDQKKIICVVVEIIIFITIIAAAVAVRYVMLASAGTINLVDDFYYEMATIKIDETLPSLSHNASYFYISVLSFVMRFLGNKVIAAVILQYALQLLTIVFLYFGIRRLVGVIPAIVSAIVFSVYYVNLGLLFEADAQCLVFFLFSISLFGVSGLYDLFTKECGSTKLVLRIFLASFFAGACSFLEPYCMLVFIFGIALCFQKSEWYSVKTKIGLFMTYMISSIAVGFVLFTITAMMNDVDLHVILLDWINALKDVKQIHYAIHFEEHSFVTALEGFILAAVALFTLPGYHVWENTKEIPFLLLLILAPVPYCTMGYLEYDLFSLWIWAALAGIGMQLMLTCEKKKVIESVLEPMTPMNPTKTVDDDIDLVDSEEKSAKLDKEIKKAAKKAEKTAKKDEKAAKKAEKAVAKDKKVSKKAEKTELAEPVKKEEKPEPAEPVKREEKPEPIELSEEVERPEPNELISKVEKAEPTESVIKAEKPEQAEPVKKEEESEPAEPVKKEEKPEPAEPINYIPNPLPVPKKHVKKVADFKVALDEDDDFDLAIDEDDDFDF